MSTSMLTPAQRITPSFATMGRRFVHRAPDRSFLQNMPRDDIFKGGIHQMKQFPQTMERYLQTSAVMKSKDLVPFVHAQPAFLRAPRLFLETLAPRKNNSFKFLRPPSAQFMVDRAPLEDKIALLSDDMHPSLQPHLVSMSFSMLQLKLMESAHYFFFTNSCASDNTELSRIHRSSAESIEKALQMRGKKAQQAKVFKHLKDLTDAYAKLRVGSLYIIGIPKNKLDTYAYASKSYGIPDTMSLSEAVKDPGLNARHLQARLLMYRDTMQPDCGLEIVDMNNADEAKQYCAGQKLESIESVAEYAEFFDSRITSVEDEHYQEQVKLDVQVKELARSL